MSKTFKDSKQVKLGRSKIMINKNKSDPERAILKKKLKCAIDKNPGFKYYLEANHCHGRFVRNVLNQCRTRIAIDRINNKYNYCKIIDSSLCGHSTPEGHSFWKKIAHQIDTFELHLNIK